jgi:hypothetical protein
VEAEYTVVEAECNRVVQAELDLDLDLELDLDLDLAVSGQPASYIYTSMSTLDI